jgi:putative ABC transport system permease protein
MKFFLLIYKNLRRNLLRSILTGLGTMTLVLVVTAVWSILWLLDLVTAEKTQDFKVIVTERWSIPSRMPLAYADVLRDGAARDAGDIRPLDSMTWQFYGGTLEKDKITRDSIIFGIACDPDKIGTMLEGLDNLQGSERQELDSAIAALKKNPLGIIVGRNHIKATNKRVGERCKLFGFSNFKGMDLEFEIVGVFPAGRYDAMAAFRSDYLANSFEDYKRRTGRAHLLADRSLNLMWLKVPDRAAFNKLASQIESSPLFSLPAVKCETASSGVAAMLEPYRDLIWFVRWPLVLACFTTLSLVIANAISISVRERRDELAVLKVLGFRPYQLLVLVLGESVLLGTVCGFVSAALAYTIINFVFEGIPFPIGFFPVFLVPAGALWWGPAIGAGTALAGSLLPAWSARNVRVADVFAKVA